MSRKKTFKIVFVALLILLAAAAAGFAVYFGTAYPADQNAKSAIDHPAAGLIVDHTKKEQIVFMPESGSKVGIVLYPGAKVSFDAYAELAERLALNGYLCALVDMPLHLALLNENAASAVMERFPNVKEWYLCGHSIGGVAASGYCWKHQESVKGLILLASRIKRDFSESELPVLLISASEDGICTPELLAANDTPNPAVFTHIVIDGGCHRYFGSYGEQKSDGTPTISREEQQDQAAGIIKEFIDRYSDEG